MGSPTASGVTGERNLGGPSSNTAVCLASGYEHKYSVAKSSRVGRENEWGAQGVN